MGRALTRVALGSFVAISVVALAGAQNLVFDERIEVSSVFGNVPRMADLDGDNDLDLISTFQVTLYWHENLHGDGSEWQTFLLGSNVPAAVIRSINAGDLDGDGDLDLLLTSSRVGGGTGQGVVSWFENANGDGSDWVLHQIASNPIGYNDAAALDMDDDGDLDIAVRVGTIPGGILRFENVAGDGTVWLESVLTEDHDSTSQIRTADIDGDGTLDLVATALQDHAAWIENVADDGSVWVVRRIAPTGPTGLAVGDIDGDGDQDFLSASPLAWHENLEGDGSGWQTNQIAGPSSPTTIEANDYDQDGDLDIVARYFHRGAIYRYENAAGDGSTWRTYVSTIRGEFVRDSHIADLDRDGYVDLITANDEEGIVIRRGTAPLFADGFEFGNLMPWQTTPTAQSTP